MLTIEARDYDEAWDKAIDEDREQIIDYMIKHTTENISIEYGLNRPYECCGGEDYDWQPLGYMDISLNDLDIQIEDIIDAIERHKDCK